MLFTGFAQRVSGRKARQCVERLFSGSGAGYKNTTGDLNSFFRLNAGFSKDAAEQRTQYPLFSFKLDRNVGVRVL